MSCRDPFKTLPITLKLLEFRLLLWNIIVQLWKQVDSFQLREAQRHAPGAQFGLRDAGQLDGADLGELPQERTTGALFQAPRSDAETAGGGPNPPTGCETCFFVYSVFWISIKWRNTSFFWGGAPFFWGCECEDGRLDIR